MAPVAEEFKALAEDILSSARDRQQAIADMKSGERERLREFRNAHDRIGGRVASLAEETRRFLSQRNDERCAAELRQQLADGEHARLEAFRAMHNGIARRVAGLTRGVRCKLEEFHNDSLVCRAIWNDLASARSSSRKPARKR